MKNARLGPAAGAAGLAMVLGMAGLARLWGLGRRSLWLGEAGTWSASHGSLADLFRSCINRDASPPLYYVLTSFALWFGDGEAKLRLLSLIASLAIVWLTYRFARLYAARPESLFAAALVGLSPYQIMVAQEAGPGMLAAAWMTLATYLFARAVWHDRSRRWPLYALAMAAALYTHPAAWLAGGVHGTLVLLSRDGRRQWRGFALALAGAIGLYAPWLLLGTLQAGRLPGGPWAVPIADARGTFQVVSTILLSPVSLITDAPGRPGLGRWLPESLAQVLLLGVPLLAMALAVPALFQRDRRGATLRLAAAILLPLFVVFAIAGRSPVWLPRGFVFTTPAVAWLIAHGLWRLRPAPARAPGVALLLGLLLFGVWRYQFLFTKEPWRAAAARIEDTAGSPPLAEDAAPGIAVLVPFDDDALRYYFRRSESEPAVFEVSLPGGPRAATVTAAELDEIGAVARRQTAAFDEVWVVIRGANSPGRREVARRAEAVAGTGRRRVEDIVFDSTQDPVLAVRFARLGASAEAGSPAR